jgi:hypothetical protein
MQITPTVPVKQVIPVKQVSTIKLVGTIKFVGIVKLVGGIGGGLQEGQIGHAYSLTLVGRKHNSGRP